MPNPIRSLALLASMLASATAVETTVLTRSGADLAGFHDLSPLVTWGGQPAGTSAFTVQTKLGRSAIGLTPAAVAASGYTTADQLRTFTSLDVRFPEVIQHASGEIEIAFDAVWDATSSSGEGGRLVLSLFHAYPDSDPGPTDVANFIGTPFGRPAYSARLLNGTTTTTTGRSMLCYGGGLSDLGEYEKYLTSWWLPGFLSAAGGTSPGSGSAWPSGSWLKTAKGVASTTVWQRFRFVVAHDRTDLWRDATRIATLPAPAASSTAPLYRWFDSFQGFRLHWRGVQNAWISNLVVRQRTPDAPALTWDAAPATSGIQGGAGTWDAWSAKFHDGLANVPWVNAAPADAVFTAPAGTVTLGHSIVARDLTAVDGYRFVLADNQWLTLHGDLDGGGVRMNRAVKVHSLTAAARSAELRSEGLRFAGAGTHSCRTAIVPQDLNSCPLVALEDGIEVDYSGSWTSNLGNSFSYLSLGAGARFRVKDDAVFSFVMSGSSQFTRQLWIHGDGTGVFDCSSGFVAERTTDPAVPVAIGSYRANGAIIITRSNANLPGHTRRYGTAGDSHYNGHFVFEGGVASAWHVRDAAQTYAGGVWVDTPTTIDCAVDTTLTGTYLLTADSYAFHGGLHANSGTTLTKTGTGTLAITGSQSYPRNTSTGVSPLLTVADGAVRFASNPGQVGSGKFGAGGANMHLVIDSAGSVIADTAVVAVRSIAQAGTLRTTGGLLTVQETYTCTTGTLDVQLVEDPLVARMQVSGAAALGGTLRIAFVDAPLADDYLVLNAVGGITGVFSTLELPVGWEPVSDATTLRLVRTSIVRRSVRVDVPGSSGLFAQANGSVLPLPATYSGYPAAQDLGIMFLAGGNG